MAAFGELIHQASKGNLTGAFEICLPGLHRDDIRPLQLMFEYFFHSHTRTHGPELPRIGHSVWLSSRPGYCRIRECSTPRGHLPRESSPPDQKSSSRQRARQRCDAQHKLSISTARLRARDLRDHHVEARAGSITSTNSVLKLIADRSCAAFARPGRRTHRR